MPVPTTQTSLSITAASNSPAGSDTVTTSDGPDEYFRALGAIVRREQAQAADTASAATVDLGAIATGSYVKITGVTTITAFGTVAAGIERTLVFTGILTLTHNATSLILPTAANIVTAVGDVAVFRSEGSGNWRCIAFDRASGVGLSAAFPGAVSGTTGTFTGAVSGTAGTFTTGTFTGAVTLPSINGGQLAGLRNRIINGDMRINQRVYVSTAALAASAYGHDRWKAGAAGGDYSFTQTASGTTLTIAANESLIQVVEDTNIEGGNYIISWTGTATGRVGKDSATPGGNFAVSPITITGQAAATTCSVEFTGANAAGGSTIATNSGTLSLVQMEIGSVATPFERRPIGVELALCRRYYRRYTGSTIYAAYGTGTVIAVNEEAGFALGEGAMRAVTSAVASNIRIYDGITASAVTSVTAVETTGGVSLTMGASGGGLTAGRPALISNNNNAAGFIEVNGEL